MTEQTFWQMLPRPLIGLAPMDGIGDHPFRHIQKKYGNPDIVYTEFTSVEALHYGDRLSMHNFLYDESQRPIIAQIYGKTPSYFRQVAIMLCEMGFDGVDINMGCPAKSVAAGGSGAGLIRTPGLAQQIIAATQAGVRQWRDGATLADCPDLPPRIVEIARARRQRLPLHYQARRAVPVSVKTRIGYETPVVDEWLPRLLAMSPAAIGLHGRTLVQGYKGVADWEAIARAVELAQGAETLILGNGDVASLAAAHERVQSYGVDGVLIGRASFGNPFVFAPPLLADSEAEQAHRHRLIQIALEHARLYEQSFGGFERYHFLPMRKHLGWYIRERHSARHLRGRLVQTNCVADVETLLCAYGMLDESSELRTDVTQRLVLHQG